MSIKLYYTSPSTTNWVTTVTSQQKEGNTYIVTLAETAFYPEGGGQPSDSGTIEGIRVIDVFEKNGEVYHRLATPVASSTVRCEIDGRRRLDHTQQHSGQHLLSAVCIDLFDAHTVGFHLGNDAVTIDLNIPSLSDEQLLAIEDRVNELIYANIPVETYYVSKEDAAALPFRKLPEVEGEIRVVEMKGVDLSVCCGTHVSITGEIGIIKLLKTEKHRGMTRLFFKCGQRALHDYRSSHTTLTTIAQHFATNRDMLANVLYKLEAENKELQKQLQQLKQTLFRIEAEKMAQQSHAAPFVLKVYDDLTLKDLQMLANEIALQHHKTAILATTVENRLVIVKSPTLNLHIGNWLKQQLQSANGKGGGNERQAQVAFPSNIELFSFINELQAEKQLMLPID
ncbi:alanyl-tRNA editing protein [Anoxybacteroides tepidamans]|uniref:alanyl-tRNA editing protein n=1 Tax=Anoxybacteroides tepidamans TaxID=265948 RepID=UPI0004848C24|nr:alanyl-tRNA editing protein [Anoxybacillus tepidamans]